MKNIKNLLTVILFNVSFLTSSFAQTNSAPTVIAGSPSFYNRYVGTPTSSFVLDLKKIFTDDNTPNLTFTVVSVAANDFIAGTSIANGLLTVNFIASETGSARIVVRATDAQALFVQYQFLMQVIPQPTPFIRINGGGSSYGSWTADQLFFNGSSYSQVTPISNTTDDVLYQTERYGTDFSYQIPVSVAGYYRANLHFAEIYHGISNTRGIGARIFNVEAEGNNVLPNYDIFLAAGGPSKAVIEEVDSVLVTDGFLSLRFTNLVDNAKISAIELAVYSTEAVPNTPPVVEHPGNWNIFKGGSITIPIIASDLNFADNLLYKATGLPASLSINPYTGIISGTVTAAEMNYPVVVTVMDDKAASAQVSFNINVVKPADYSFKINTGGTAKTFGSEKWESDQFFLDGKTFISTEEITNTTKDAIYQAERFGTRINYQIPMPGAGRYNVTLHFAEIFWTGVGQRTFNVDIESGKAALNNYDIFQEAGGANLAVSESFTVEVTDGALTLVFSAVIDQAKISGIEISSCISPVINSVTASVSEICVGGSSTITVNGALGGATAWKLYSSSCGGTLVASNTTGVFQVSPTVTTTYYVKAEGGCILPATCQPIEIKVGVVPNVTITPAGPFCTGDAAVNLTAATIGGNWSGPGITNAVSGTFNPAIAGAGSHVITYTRIIGTCTYTDTETIQVNLGPNATITSPGIFCENQAPVNLTAGTAGGTWSGTGITNPTLGTFSPAVATAGSHIITYTVTSGSCTSVGTKTIEVISVTATNATIAAAGPFCTNGTPVNLTAATPGGTWSGTGITNASLGTFSPSVAGAGNHVITYTLTAGTCSAVDTETIKVDAVLNATISPAGPFCQNAPATNLIAATPGGTWSGVGITNPTMGTFNPSVAGPGNHVITYTLTSGACTSVDTETIYIPNATITTPGSFCVNDTPVTLTAATAGGTWSGVGITSSSLGTFSPSVAGPGNHIITYTIIAGACTTSDTETIKVDALPNATITAAGPFCSGAAAVNLTAATAGGTWSGNGITNATLGTFNPTIAGQGSHVITYTLVSGECTSVDTETIQVNLQPNATIETTLPFCASDAPSNLRSATAGGTWSGTGITNATLGTFDPSIAGPGNHVITYTITTGSCTSVDTETVKVDAIPNLTIAAAGPFCEGGASVNLTAATPGGIWSGTGITDPALGTFSPTVAGIGSHLIGYALTTGACTSLGTQTIQVIAKPNVTITPVAPLCPSNSPITLMAATAGGTWSGTGITNATLGTFSPSVSGSGSHVITYTLTTGSCTSVDTESIQVKNVNTTVTLSGTTLTSSAVGATYQWINCAGNTNISGETAKSFTTQQIGSYAVRVTENGCTSVSACVDVLIVAVKDNISDAVMVYPNPASEKLVIDLPTTSSNVSFTLTDVAGRTAWNAAYDYVKSVEVDTKELNAGIYLLRINSAEIKTTIKVIIK